MHRPCVHRPGRRTQGRVVSTARCRPASAGPGSMPSCSTRAARAAMRSKYQKAPGLLQTGHAIDVISEADFSFSAWWQLKDRSWASP